MAAELAQTVAERACRVLYDDCYVPVSGDGGLLGGFVSKSMVSDCGGRVVECQ